MPAVRAKDFIVDLNYDLAALKGRYAQININIEGNYCSKQCRHFAAVWKHFLLPAREVVHSTEAQTVPESCSSRQRQGRASRINRQSIRSQHTISESKQQLLLVATYGGQIWAKGGWLLQQIKVDEQAQWIQRVYPDLPKKVACLIEHETCCVVHNFIHSKSIARITSSAFQSQMRAPSFNQFNYASVFLCQISKSI